MTVRMTHYKPDDRSSILITACNVTKCILFNQLKEHNEILSIINATTSHELRNPLNALIACNVEKEALYEQIFEILMKEVSLTAAEIKEVKEILSKLKEGNKI